MSSTALARPSSLAGRRALVTGSTAGIGFAIALALAEQGAAVVLNGRHASTLALAVERLHRAVVAAEVDAVQADLGTSDGASHLAEAAGVTKAAQISLARGLAETCAGTGVTVNSVLPGPTLTEGAAAYFEAAAQRQGIAVDEAKREFFAQARPTSLIRRFIDPAEVAALVVHVCSPLCGAIQGAALRVDGGVVRSMV